jgi:hypothetical protein
MGAVDGCVPTDAGPSGRARCKKESGFAMLGKDCADSSLTLWANCRRREGRWVGVDCGGNFASEDRVWRRPVA